MKSFLRKEWTALRQRGLSWMLLFACVLVAFVVAQQGETVDRQRMLIQSLDSDSRELYSSRMRELGNRLRKPKTKSDPGAPDKKQPEPAAPEATEPPPTVEPVNAGPRLIKSI